MSNEDRFNARKISLDDPNLMEKAKAQAPHIFGEAMSTKTGDEQQYHELTYKLEGLHMFTQEELDQLIARERIDEHAVIHARLKPGQSADEVVTVLIDRLAQLESNLKEKNDG